MTKSICSIPGLKNKFDTYSSDVREYFKHIPALVDQIELEVCLAYVFLKLEKGQNNALYCGAVKLYQTDRELTWNAISLQRIDRNNFEDFYKIIFTFKLPKDAHTGLKFAVEIRNKIMHGKNATSDEMRNAIAKVLEFAEEVNKQLSDKHSFKPFGDLRSVSGASKKLDKNRSRFILKGMGFDVK